MATTAKKRQRPDVRSRKLGEPVNSQTKKRAPVRVKHLKQQLRNDLVPVDCDPVQGLQAALAGLYGLHLRALAEMEAASADGEYTTMTMWGERKDGSRYPKTNPYVEMVRSTSQDLAYASATAVKVGLDAKVAEAMEKQAESIARVMGALIDDLELTAAQKRRLPGAMGGALRLLDAGS